MKLRNMTLYSIFVRNDGGTFAAVERDLPRLKALGVDAIWLMPIHPIGTEKRKGSLGSPYAISGLAVRDFGLSRDQSGVRHDGRLYASVRRRARAGA